MTATEPRHLRRGATELELAQLYRILQLRSEIFVLEQNCPYLDPGGRDLEPEAEHHWVEVDGRIVATLRVLAEPSGERRIGRVCTAESARGNGFSSLLITAVIEQYPDTTLVLDAQAHLVDHYGRFGFVAEGEEFDEDGIPHRAMRRVPPRAEA